jgi:hypothetical protein
VRRSWSSERFAESIGTAKPTPSNPEPEPLERICALIPIRRVRLDRVDQVVAGGEGRDRAADRRDDADREGVGVAEGAADRRHGLADDDAVGVAERHGGEGMVGRVDADHADVVEQVVADDLRADAVAVGELDVDRARRADRAGRALAGRGDHVRARQDRPVLGDDEAGALARPGVGQVRRVEVRDDRHDPGEALSVELGGLEAVADERLGGEHGGVVGSGRRLLAYDDRLLRPGVEPPGRLRHQEHSGPAEHGGDEREGGNGAGAHGRPL